MKNILSRLGPADVVAEPFPHVIVRNALPDEICERLIAEFPPIEVVSEGQPYGSNERFSYSAASSLADARVSDAWKELVQAHTSQEFLDDVKRVFRAHLGGADGWRAGLRKRDGYDAADVLLDAQICVNTPVTGTPDSVRVAHVDAPDKVFAGLLYLKHPGDDARGGDLELYRYVRDDFRFFQGQHVEAKYIEKVKTVAYEKNVFVFFLNSISSLHGVTVREKTDATRCFFNLVGEVQAPRFDVKRRQESRLRRFLRKHDLFGVRTIRY